MTDRIDAFSTPILKAVHPTAAPLNEALVSAINAERARSSGVSKSNIGGWHSEATMVDWGGDAAHALADFAIDTASPHMADIAAAGKRDFQWTIQMWANINPPGAMNALHCHPGAFWSGVYYPDPGGAEARNGGGELIFEDPRFPMAYSQVPDLVFLGSDGEPMRSQTYIRPQPGLLVLFPSWLRHEVKPHRGTRDRISIALNLLVHPS
ncbi:MAG: 2OG-Fe(II) oxygenase family protein [Pseudomonadota bacterium]